MRVLLVIFERSEYLTCIFKIFHSIEVCWLRKKFISMKTQTSRFFSQPKELFSSTSKLFLSSNSMRHTFHHGLQKHIFTWISQKTSQNWMKHVSSWSYMKISSYEVMSIFSVFGRIFTAHTWFVLFSLFFKFVSLSTCSALIHMRIKNQVEKFSKFIIKILESFHQF